MSHTMLEVLEDLIFRNPSIDPADAPDFIAAVAESEQGTAFMTNFLKVLKAELKKLLGNLDQQKIHEALKSPDLSDSVDFEVDSVASELIESIDHALEIIEHAKKVGVKDPWKEIPVDIFSECTSID